MASLYIWGTFLPEEFSEVIELYKGIQETNQILFYEVFLLDARGDVSLPLHSANESCVYNVIG